VRSKCTCVEFVVPVGGLKKVLSQERLQQCIVAGSGRSARTGRSKRFPCVVGSWRLLPVGCTPGEIEFGSGYNKVRFLFGCKAYGDSF
jgi:hypothetical protein